MFPGLNNGARRNLLLHRVEFIKPLHKQPLQGASPAPPRSSLAAVGQMCSAAGQEGQRFQVR